MQTERRLKPFSFFTNYDGQNEGDGVFRIQPSSAALIQNLHPNRAGEYTAYNQGDTDYTSALESGSRIDSLGTYRTDTGSTYFLCAVNGKVLNINISTGANDGTITTSNTAANLVDFQTFKGSVYIVEKSMTPEVWAGSGSASAVAAIPLTNGSETYDKPALVCAYRNRLVYGNFNGSTVYPSHIAISNDLAPDTFTLAPTSTATNGAVIQVNPGDGQYLTAMENLYIPSQADNYLILFKNESIYSLTGTSPTTFALAAVSNTVGAINNKCVVNIGNDLIFLGKQNIYSLSGATESGTLQPNAIGSSRVQETLASMSLTTSLTKAWAIHLPSRYEAWFVVPTGSSSEGDVILVYNYRETQESGGPGVWIVRTGMNATCGVEYNGTLYTGTSTGYMRKWFTTSTYDGTGYNWVYKYPYYNFEHQTQIKKIPIATAYFLTRRTTTISITTRWRNGGASIEKTFSRVLTLNEGSTYGNGVYGTDSYGTDGYLSKINFPVLGNGEQVQFEFSGTTDGLGPTFLGMSGWVEFGDASRKYR